MAAVDGSADSRQRFRSARLYRDLRSPCGDARSAWRRKGVLWESNLIYGELYGAGAVTGKYVPIGFGSVAAEHVPQARLREATGFPGDIYDIRVILDSFDPLAMNMNKVERVRTKWESYGGSATFKLWPLLMTTSS